MYSSFETWWHTVMHGRESEGVTGEWSVLFHFTSERGKSSITTNNKNMRQAA
jgi:hypothetical protein